MVTSCAIPIENCDAWEWREREGRNEIRKEDVGFAYGCDDANVFPLTTDEMRHREEKKKKCEIFRGRVLSSPTETRGNEVETVYFDLIYTFFYQFIYSSHSDIHN